MLMESGLLAAPSPEAPKGEAVHVSWHGSPWSLAGLGLVNALLSLLTLGIYSFWGRTEVRQRIWSSVRLNGEPLEYTGRGLELFLGFVIVFGVFLLPSMLLVLGLTIGLGQNHPITVLAMVGLYVLAFFLWGVAAYRARRYRLSRTHWRGVRGWLDGSPTRYGWTSFWSFLLIPFTAGWIMPWRSNLLYRAMTNDMRFGNRPFRYAGQAGPLYPPYVVSWIGSGLSLALYFGILVWVVSGHTAAGAMPDEVALDTGEQATIYAGVALMVLGFALSSAWYNARALNHFTNHTAYEGATFRLKAGAGGLLWMVVSNYLLTVLTLTVLKPVAEARMARYMVERLEVTGSVDFADIGQSAAAIDKRGEGLAEAFDIDAFG